MFDDLIETLAECLETASAFRVRLTGTGAILREHIDDSIYHLHRTVERAITGFATIGVGARISSKEGTRQSSGVRGDTVALVTNVVLASIEDTPVTHFEFGGGRR